MGFGPMWRQVGDDIAPVSPAIDTMRLFATGGEYGTLQRTNDELLLNAQAGGALILRSDNKVMIKKENTNRIETDSNGIGVFATTPVAQQDKQADLNVGVSGLEDTQTFCNTLQERLAAYGWFA